MHGIRTAETRRKAEIGATFGAAADHYDASAAVQRLVAAHLAAMAAREKLPKKAHILEIGCGTGLLTQEIRHVWPSATLIATDLAPDMLLVAGKRGAANQLLCHGRRGTRLRGRWFDLILSSLAFQWFDDIGRRPGPAPRPAQAWREPLFRDHGRRQLRQLARGARTLRPVGAGSPTIRRWRHCRRCWRPIADAFVCDEHHLLTERGGAALVRHFRGIGAQVPRAGYRPLGPAGMRRVIRAFDEAGGETSYHVLYGRLTNAG